MTFFENNLKVLIDHNLETESNLLGKINPSSDLEIRDTQSGFPTALYKGNFIHSPHNPLKEAEQIITSQVPDQVSLCVFYGFGLGYLPESFINHFPEIPCLIIEPDLSFFLKALYSRDLRRLFSCKHVMFLLGTESENVVGVMERSSLSCLHLIKLRSVFEKNADFYNRLDNIFEFYLKKREINKNTLKRFGKLWIKNLCANIRMISKTPGINKLSLLLKGFPALIVAAGPSLDSFLPFLKELAERMAIIAVDTSMAVCQKYGVDPDFVIIADPQYWNTRYLDRVRPGNYILIAESATHPRVFRLLDCPTFMGGSLFPFGKYIESVVGEKGKLGAGGSVATSAWDFARLAGADPIFLAGLDLGFPHKSTHFKGSYFEDNFHNSCYRFLTAEQMSFAYLHNAGPVKAAANNNASITTDQRMLLYKYWFESQAKLYPQVNTINLSPYGLKIDGIPYQEGKELLKLDQNRTLINERLDSVKNDYNALDSKNLQRLRQALNDFVRELESLKCTAGEGLHYSNLMEKRMQNGENIDDLLAAFSQIDEQLLNKTAKTVVGFLLQPLINEIVDTQFPGTDQTLVLQYSKKLYLEIISSAEYHLGIIKKTISLL